MNNPRRILDGTVKVRITRKLMLPDTNYAPSQSSKMVTNTLVTPAWQNVLRGLNVTIQVNVTNDCSQNINDATVQLNYSRSSPAGGMFSCTPVNNEGNGLYNCTFNTTSPVLLEARQWNVTMFSGKNFYNNATTTNLSAFFIETRPIFTTTPSVSPSPGGWGETFNWTVNVSDEDLDNVNVVLFEKLVGSGTWNQVTSTIINGNNQTVALQKNHFTSDDIRFIIKFKVMSC